MSDNNEGVSFRRWISRPQSLIALSAVLLSLCGLFISIYEASIVRRTQRASVWPHVEVALTLLDETGLDFWVRNVGVGPALIRSAAVTYEGELLDRWQDLFRLVDPETKVSSLTTSLINGRVLPGPSEAEIILEVAKEDEDQVRQKLEAALMKAIFARKVDITICYCSVYDECWISRLQDGIARLSDATSVASAQKVDDCRGELRSRI